MVRLRRTAGQRGDAPQAGPLLAEFARGAVGGVIADAGSDADDIRKRVRPMRARTGLRPNPTRTVAERYDRRRDRHRNVIERFVGALERFRRVATRYEKKAENDLGFVWLAAVLTGRV